MQPLFNRLQQRTSSESTKFNISLRTSLALRGSICPKSWLRFNSRNSSFQNHHQRETYLTCNSNSLTARICSCSKGTFILRNCQRIWNSKRSYYMRIENSRDSSLFSIKHFVKREMRDSKLYNWCNLRKLTREHPATQISSLKCLKWEKSSIRHSSVSQIWSVNSSDRLKNT